MEKNPNKRFRDDATQSVWFRNMPPQRFTITLQTDGVSIDTGACKLLVKKRRTDCRIEINGRQQPIDNRQNLKGTARTLDNCDGATLYSRAWEGDMDTQEKVNLGTGVCSLSGVAVFDDAKSLTLAENGEVTPTRGEGTDEYIFAYGSAYREAIKALYLITGFTPKIPRFALGNWWSRYHAYTDKEYLKLLNSFEEREVPLTVATIDMDWHYSGDVREQLPIGNQNQDANFYGHYYGWTGYTWNTNLFPNHTAFLSKIEKKNLKITLNLHPADGVRWWEAPYQKMANAVGMDASKEEWIRFDITNPTFINAYFDVLHKPYEKEGVTFWWIDWQQGENSTIEGLDPLWSLNHYHYLDNAENHLSPLILSRYAGIGSHRYPLGFSGDTFVTWKTLSYLPYFTATASNIGYTWWSHDIGGHQQGIQDNEMYVRHIQYGVVSPINRLHCSNSPTMTKEPWAYENGTGKVAEDWFRFRHSLIPFLYTQSYLTHKQGKALVEPLYYQWTQKEAYTYKSEYLFGDLLVAPVLQKAKKDGFARVKAWLPEGTWTDIFTGDYYISPEGGKEITLLRHLESIPILAKAGTILPLSLDKGNDCDNPRKLALQIYNGNGEFTLYEDGIASNRTGEVFTHFTTTLAGNKQSLTIQATGDFSILPENRVLRVLFKNIEEGEVVLYKNGVKMENDGLLTDCAGIEFSFEANATYLVETTFTTKTELERLLARAQKVLLRAEENHVEKYDAYPVIQQANSIAEYLEIVEKSTFSSATKLRLTETIL